MKSAHKSAPRAVLKFTMEHRVPIIIALFVLIAGTFYMHGWLTRGKDVYVLDKSAPAPSYPPDDTPDAAAAPPAESLANGKVTVYITGEVVNPGVYEVDAGSRVNDVLNLAGGGAGDADLTRINLATIVADGMQITVPKAGGDETAPAPISTAQGPEETLSDGPVNINTADEALLETLPGVGPATAKDIIDYRTSHGAFKKIEDIMNVSGIGEKKFEKLKDLITVS
ncbi:MAG: helix-hairpin-helix domain-containing protein [Defluviitaleaceae bacterium]|nr:helix-hairpin-helix domain-containing protein [Defluviitaleaceae bacterium]